VFAEQCRTIRQLARVKLRQVTIEQFQEFRIVGNIHFSNR